jgi:hypothetical protein
MGAFLYGGVTMQLLLSDKTRETFKIPQIVDIGHTFITNPRKAPWPKRKMSDIRYIVIHHSASTGTLQAENGYHTRPAPNGNDWYKLSYHFSIDRGGIYQINDILDITPHAKGANDHGIGICVNWDLRLRGLTDFEKNALYGLVTTLKDMFPNAEIVGHNEISKRLANHGTACPIISMNQLRSDIMTAELNLHIAETPNDMKARIFTAYGRFSDLYKVATTEGKYQKEAERKCLQIAAEMEKAGIIVAKQPL